MADPDRQLIKKDGSGRRSRTLITLTRSAGVGVLNEASPKIDQRVGVKSLENSPAGEASRA
jgi:hypothetical protein